MTCQDPIQRLLPWYIKGMLNIKEQKAVEAHLRTCATCRRSEVAYKLLVDVLEARKLDAPPPSTDALLARLPHLSNQRRFIGRSLWDKVNRWWPWLLLRAQEKVVRREIWIASALVMVLGTLVTLATTWPYSSSGMLPLVLISPIVTAMSVAFIYGPAVDPALEIELATPASTRLILLARLVLIFGFNFGLGLIGSATLAGLRSDISLWPLVTAWLAPMAFLSALAFLLTVLTTDPGIGVLVSLGLWTLQGLGRVTNLVGTSWNLPDLTASGTRPWLWVLTLLFAGLALWASESEERWLGGHA